MTMLLVHITTDFFKLLTQIVFTFKCSQVLTHAIHESHDFPDQVRYILLLNTNELAIYKDTKVPGTDM